MKRLISARRILLLTLTALCFLGPLDLLACTTVVISGRFTKSGRPMLWKIRDTEEYANHIRRMQSPLGYYIGLMNDSDTLGIHVWGGHNSRGFGIMNSASFNVNKGDTAQLIDQEGILMKKALAECRNLRDFEMLLDTLPRPMGIAGHFGVIDAEGGAAFYEVNNHTWQKFDVASDPRGYVIRTNYSHTGDAGEGLGYVRYSCATKLFEKLKQGEIDVLQLGSLLSRSMLHGLLDIDYRQLAETDALPSKTGFINSDDLITRYGTSSMILIEGVRPTEDPLHATSWVQIGNPYLSPLVPIWTWQAIPEALSMPQPEGDQTLGQLAMALKRRLYPITTVEEQRYLYMPLIYRPDGKGISQELEALERQCVPLIQSTTNRSELQRLQSVLISISRDVLSRALSIP